MRNPIHFLNLISKLIIYFNKYLTLFKLETIWNIYSFQLQLFKDLWIDFRVLKLIFRRFLKLLDEIHFLDYQR
jgi:hypothetical protein